MTRLLGKRALVTGASRGIGAAIAMRLAREGADVAITYERSQAQAEAVAAAITGLKERGFESPYLRAFVVARINPLRFQRGTKAEFDETIDKMLAAARRFDPARIRADQVARAAGPPDESAAS